jgi:ribosomal protein S18 acetylase RimI-like enzyme
MTKLRRYSIPLDDAACDRVRAAALMPAPDAIEPFDAARDSEAVATFVAVCRGVGTGMTAGLRASGLLAEMAGRTGRAVRGWICRRNDGSVAGLVCLVESRAADRRRFSISWLIVAPPARRCQVGSRLVLHAMQAARTEGAVVVHAETKAEWQEAVAFWDRLKSRVAGSA